MLNVILQQLDCAALLRRRAVVEFRAINLAREVKEEDTGFVLQCGNELALGQDHGSLVGKTMHDSMRRQIRLKPDPTKNGSHEGADPTEERIASAPAELDDLEVAGGQAAEGRD